GLKEAKELERRALMHLEWKERRVENRGRKKKKKRKTKEGSDKHEREKKDKKKKKGDTAIVISPYFFRSSSLLRRMFPRLSALFSSQGSRRGPPRRDARPTDDGADDSWGLFPRVIGVQRTNDPTRTGTYTKKSPASSASRREERYTSEGRGPDSGQVGASSDETYLFFPQEHTSRSIIRGSTAPTKAEDPLPSCETRPANLSYHSAVHPPWQPPKRSCTDERDATDSAED
ncbi:hypothetical protein FOZ62_005199, partial [Perkinsus olseni]